MYLILMIRMFKKYKCGSNISCIAKKGEIETKMRKTHKTIVKQRENKIKTRQNAHFYVKTDDLTVKIQYNNTTLRKNIVVFY